LAIDRDTLLIVELMAIKCSVINVRVN